MADETKDVKKKQQISLVLRYYYRRAVKESLLQFEAAEHLNAAGLANKIIHILDWTYMDGNIDTIWLDKPTTEHL